MTLEEMQKKKLEVETAIAALIQQFTFDTQLTVDYVNVDKVYYVGSTYPTYSAKLEVKL